MSAAGQQPVSSVHTVKFVKGVGTFDAYLKASTGEIYQLYERGNKSNVTPVIDAQNPVTVEACVVSSLGGVAEIVVEWEIGGTVLKFNASGACITGDWAGRAALGGPAGSPTSVLKFTDDLVDVLSESSVMVARIQFDPGDGNFVQTTAMAPIRITAVSQNDRTVIILGFVRNGSGASVQSLNITDNMASKPGGTVSLEARYFEGVSPAAIPAGLTVEWAMFDNDTPGSAAKWDILSGTTSPKVADGKVGVSAGDVNSTRLFRVRLMDGTGAVVCQDTERVRDLTDTLMIARNPNRDEIIYAPGSAGYAQGLTDRVTYAPRLMQEAPDGTQTEITDHSGKFWFEVIGPDGETMQGAAAANVATYTLDLGAMQQAQGDVELSITTSY